VRRLALALALVAAAALPGCAESTEVTGKPAPPAPPAAVPEKPGKLPPGKGYILARVRENVLAYDRPNGRPVARLRKVTPFGEPRTLGIRAVRDERRWLAVHSPVFANDEIGWIPNDPDALALSRTRISLHVSLSNTEIDLRRAGKLVHEIPIAVGRAGTETPAGRYQVTDKLPASRFPQGPYGCCIIPLSARQPNLPEGWAGGDRIAIHGTSQPETIGQAASNGCLRASDPDLEILMRDVPVGAPVFIKQ
jgi:lipoprotein-anchoring transpeptidase ErfK/SrfK